MRIEDAVNEALDDSDLFMNPRFIMLMKALYEHAESHFQSDMPDYHECITNIQSAIGEFVPVEVDK